jgi:ubiquinone/menaquinone biosynthesis C-methylase UbiE
MSFPAGLTRVAPPAVKPIARAIYHRLFRLHLRIRFWCADRFSAPDISVPPAILRYRVSELLPVSEFLRVGQGCASLIRQRANQMGIDFSSAHRVLDFGCGCGRTIAWFLRDCEAEFHGVDVDADAIEWCKKHLPSGHFAANAPAPPLPYPASHFDVVYCLSVFTHLNESMQDLWLEEMSRILKPGGVFLLTTHGLDAATGLDEEGQKALEADGFVHRRTQKLRGIVPDWYQTTWHSRDYIVNRLSGWFEDVRHYAVPGGTQDVVTARKV